MYSYILNKRHIFESNREETATNYILGNKKQSMKMVKLIYLYSKNAFYQHKKNVKQESN